MGWLNRELALTHHAARDYASSLVDVLRGGMPRQEDLSQQTSELSRQARAAWTAERRALTAERHVAQSLERARDAEEDRDRWQVRALQADHDARETEARALQAEARAMQSEHDARQMRSLMTTRRVRFGLGLGHWLDRLRGR
jgi:hypothetical protein